MHAGQARAFKNPPCPKNTNSFWHIKRSVSFPAAIIITLASESDWIPPNRLTMCTEWIHRTFIIEGRKLPLIQQKGGKRGSFLSFPRGKKLGSLFILHPVFSKTERCTFLLLICETTLLLKLEIKHFWLILAAFKYKILGTAKIDLPRICYKKNCI